jgi:hypothetical protein
MYGSGFSKSLGLIHRGASAASYSEAKVSSTYSGGPQNRDVEQCPTNGSFLINTAAFIQARRGATLLQPPHFLVPGYGSKVDSFSCYHEPRVRSPDPRSLTYVPQIVGYGVGTT